MSYFKAKTSRITPDTRYSLKINYHYIFHSCMCFYVFLLFWTFISLIVVFVFISSLLLLLERFMY